MASGLVFAGGCSNINAYVPGSGALAWNVTTPQVLGLSAANGVLYACESTGGGQGTLFAYDAASGALRWSAGGPCNAAPVIANGVVLSAFANITQYALPLSSSAIAPAVARPEISDLRPDFRLPAQRTPEALAE